MDRRPGDWLTLLRLAAVTAAVLGLTHGTAEATLRYGDIQLSGNLSAQQLFRIQRGSETFSAFDWVQQRNTFRLQYEHDLVKGGDVLGGMATLPFIRDVGLFVYYRFAYDSIYDIAPGGTFETQSGAIGGQFDPVPFDPEVQPANGIARGIRKEIAFENNIREIFVDVTTDWPVSFRIGRQQIVWGEALSFRALDSVNALDISWHLQQEAGLLGKVGFDELRIPAWTVKMLVNLGSLGPLSQQYLEVWDIPFDFQPAFARFLPAPWSIPVRNPFRGGLVLPVEGQNVQVCFDMTGNPRPSEGSIGDTLGTASDPVAVDFSETARTGMCPSAGRKQTKIGEGLYDPRDPTDVNQVGARYGAQAFGIGLTLNYMYRRQLGADIPTAGALKAQVGALRGGGGAGDPAAVLGYITLDDHSTTDPITRQTSDTIGYARVPAEFYYPYVNVWGASMNYFEEFTGAVYTLEATYTKGLPIATLNPFGNGIKKKDVILGAVNFDRPTWIRFLNRRSTWLVIGQLNFNWIRHHEKIRPTGTVNPATMEPELDGDVGLPNATLIPELVDGPTRLDRLKELELLSIFAATTFYRGGTLAPLVAWIPDWANFPSMAFIATLDFYPTNNLIISPALRIYTNFGRTVDEPWGVGRLSQWDEVQLKITYQF